MHIKTVQVVNFMVCGFLKQQLKIKGLRRLVQGGGVEGRALTPSCESTGITPGTTNC